MAASIAKRAEMEAVRGGAEAFLKQADTKMLMKDTASWSKKMADVQKDSSVEPLDVQILRIGKQLYKFLLLPNQYGHYDHKS